MRTCLIAVLITGVLCFSCPAWSERLLTLLEPAGDEAWVTGEQTIRWELGGCGMERKRLLLRLRGIMGELVHLDD